MPNATHACRETANWDAVCADARKTPPKRVRGVSRNPLRTPGPLLPNTDPEVAREYVFRFKGLLEQGEGIERPMLFDLEADLSQKHDVAAEHPEIVAELRGLMEAIRKSSSRAVAAAVPRRGP